jgi:multidrug resistance efflux pump
MFRKYLLPLFAAGMFAFAGFHVLRGQQTPADLPPPVEPARTPYGETVSGAGIVEPRTENIQVGSPVGGVIAEVAVAVGEKVAAGNPLFRLDDRHLLAELKVRQADLAAADEQLARLEQMPRPEELPASEARVREAKAHLAAQEDYLRRIRNLTAGKAAAREELVRRDEAFQIAREQLARAEAEHHLLTAGAWEPEKAVARAAVAQAKAQVEQTRIDLERLCIRAPLESEVLQVNIRPGEFVGAPPGQALVVLGDVHRLHVRVDIDEHDIPRFQPGAPACAMLRGHAEREYPLTFVRVEPYVIPKQSLTGASMERVDTRVLQVIYALETTDHAVYVGQQMDVFIQVK